MEWPNDRLEGIALDKLASEATKKSLGRLMIGKSQKQILYYDILLYYCWSNDVIY